jgi:hypothetical protein
MKIHDIAQAIYIVNKHAKTATDSRYLYQLKKESIEKLLKEKKAFKKGLHFSPNPKLCQQRVDTIIELDQYLFHIPSSKEDRELLPHLGERDQHYRNPKTNFSLKKAKGILEIFLGKEKKKPEKKKELNKTIFLSSYLGNK